MTINRVYPPFQRQPTKTVMSGRPLVAVFIRPNPFFRTRTMSKRVSDQHCSSSMLPPPLSILLPSTPLTCIGSRQYLATLHRLAQPHLPLLIQWMTSPIFGYALSARPLYSLLVKSCVTAWFTPFESFAHGLQFSTPSPRCSPSFL